MTFDEVPSFPNVVIKDLTPEEIEMQDEVIEDAIQNPENLNGENSHDNIRKGNFGEMRADQYLREKGYTQLNQEGVTDLDNAGHHGIDGVHYNPNGHPQYLIVEVKYGSGKLGETADGKQMSQQWIDSRLDEAVGKEKADEIRKEMQNNPANVRSAVSFVNKEGNVTLKPLDKDGNIIKNATCFD